MLFSFGTVQLLSLLDQLHRHVGICFDLAFGKTVLLAQDIVIDQDSIVSQGKTGIGYPSRELMTFKIFAYVLPPIKFDMVYNRKDIT